MDALMYLDPLVVSLIALVIALFVTLLVTIVLLRQRKLLQRYRLLLNGQSGQDLEGMLLAQAEQLETFQTQLGSLSAHVSDQTTRAKLHIQKTAIVRFNAFPDTGSDLSFAIAMLDANHNGFVLSNLYGRAESRVYAKPILNGTSTYPLSEEEKRAIAQAIGH